MNTKLEYVPYSMFVKDGVTVTFERAESVYDKKGNLPKDGVPFKPAYYWRAVLEFSDGYNCAFGKGKDGPGGKQIIKRKAIEFIESKALQGNDWPDMSRSPGPETIYE